MKGLGVRLFPVVFACRIGLLIESFPGDREVAATRRLRMSGVFGSGIGILRITAMRNFPSAVVYGVMFLISNRSFLSLRILTLRLVGRRYIHTNFSMIRCHF